MTRIPHQEDPTTRRLRAFTLALFIAGALGILIDLGLIGHYEDLWQVAPLLLLGSAAGASLAVVLRPSRVRLRVFRLVLLSMTTGGIVGLWLHYQANLEFEREVSPALAGVELIWKAVRGASPPSAAPAGLIQLALLGWAYTVRHPALRRSSSSAHIPGGLE